jgi:Threonine dehydrogenase and related Zn-dependent dehydrogenases
MRALCWHGKEDVSVDTIDDPTIEDPRDAIVRVTATAICGSDLHIYGGMVPTMENGDVLGHEFMGEVVAVGNAVKGLAIGDRVVVPFTISCGSCFFCQRQEYSLCDTTNPGKEKAIAMMGHATSGMFGYSHMTGGFKGGQAEYVRVPHADIGPIKIPAGLPDDKVLFLSDIFPTGYMAAENADIEPGDTVAVWGCGPVGQFCIQSAWMLGAGRVIAIDNVGERLGLAGSWGKAETIASFDPDEIYERLMEMTNGRGPDSCIDAVGAEAHGHGVGDAIADKAKSLTRLPLPHPHVLQQIARCCRKGGTLSVPGVYLGYANMFPIGGIMNKALTLKTGQTHMQRYLAPLLDRVLAGEIDLSRVITHRLPLSEAPRAYRMFQEKKDGCIKVVMTP